MPLNRCDTCEKFFTTTPSVPFYLGEEEGGWEDVYVCTKCRKAGMMSTIRLANLEADKVEGDPPAQD